MGLRIENLPPPMQAKVREQLARDEARRKPVLPEATPPAEYTGPERDFQTEFDAWLQSIGYAPRTPKHIQRSHTGKWRVHQVDCENNPILLDVVLLDSLRGAYLELELKNAEGDLTPDQRALVCRHEGFVIRSMAQGRTVVGIWEREGIAAVRQWAANQEASA